MPPNVLFAFGPDNAYFFYCQGTVIHDNCSWAFRQTVPAKLGIPYHISLGPGENEYCAFYETREGRLWQSINYPRTPWMKNVEQFFAQQHKEKPTMISSSHVAIAPHNQFFACSQLDTMSFDFAPPAIKAPVMSRLDIIQSDVELSNGRSGSTFNGSTSTLPSQVSFGASGEWFIRWPDGLCAWDFKPAASSQSLGSDRPSYLRLRQLLGSDSSAQVSDEVRRSIDYLVLDLYHPQHWFCVLRGGTQIEFSLPQNVIDQITPVINKYIKTKTTASTMTPAGRPLREGLTAVSQCQTLSQPPRNHNSKFDETLYSAKAAEAQNERIRTERAQAAESLNSEPPPSYREIENSAPSHQAPNARPSWRFWRNSSG